MRAPATDLAHKTGGHGSSIEKRKYDETPCPETPKHVNKNGTALVQVLRRYSLLNSCPVPDIASDQLYTLKTGNDSNAKALRMLVFYWRHPATSRRHFSDAKKSARSLIWRFLNMGWTKGIEPSTTGVTIP
ncbi:hypothetical protein, partial [Pseudomonas sp.]|uniref:hypothetical protein n=1 Tax=Pseudomonas sp. TaxID=306 RepID=UPI003262D1D0